MNIGMTFSIIIIGAIIVILLLALVIAKRKRLIMAFTIQAGGEKRLIIKSNAKWRQTEIWFDGLLASTLSRQELTAGYDLRLSDDSTLKIKLTNPGFQPPRLQITRNGQPISNTITGYDNLMVIHNAANLVYLIAVVNLIVGVISLFFKIEVFAPFEFGWLNIVFGLIFLVLGYFTQRRSVLALFLFITIFGLDSIPVIFLSLQSGSYLVILILLFRFIFLAPAFLALGEIYRCKNKIVSKIFNTMGVGLLVVPILGMLILLAWAIMNVFTSVKELTSAYPNIVPQSAPKAATKGEITEGSCYLKIKDTATAVSLRDKANSTTGKVVGYLDKNDVALVLGNDGGSPGNEWWLIEVPHAGQSIRGWVTAKWVEFEKDANCSLGQPIATPFP